MSGSNRSRSPRRRGSVALLPAVLGLMAATASCGPMNEHNEKSHSEYDEKWLDANYAHVAGKIAVPEGQGEEYVEFFTAFGRAHEFTILVDRDRPGPPGTLPSILMTRNDGVEIDTADFLVTRVGFGLRQPAPRDEWKSIAEDLLEELVATFGSRLVIEFGTWLPLGEGTLVASLWGASRELNLKSERLFAGTNQELPDELIQSSECMGRPCELSYHFAHDQLYRVRLSISELEAMDYVPIYRKVADKIGELYGPTLDGTGRAAADSLRWEVNYTRVDWSWKAHAGSYQAILEYSDLDYVPRP